MFFFFGRGGGEKVTTFAGSNFESENFCQAVVVPARFRVSIQAVCCELHAFESSQSGEVLLRLPSLLLLPGATSSFSTSKQGPG